MILFLTGCTMVQTQQEEVLVGAAASLTNVLEEIKEDFEATHSDIKINYLFASSGTIRAQMEQGGELDIFISADAQDVDKVKRFVPDMNFEMLLRNHLVLITNEENSELTFESFLQDSNKQIAIGDPDSVPAGKYAKQMLEFYQLYDEVEATLNFATDVRQVLTWVETNQIPYGFVYQSDAYTSEQVRIIELFEHDECEAIDYPLIQLKQDFDTNVFVDFLKEQSSLFEQYGFEPWEGRN